MPGGRVLPEPLGGLPPGAELPADHPDRGHLVGVVLDGRQLGAGTHHPRRHHPAGRQLAVLR